MLRYGNTSWSQLGSDISGNNEVGETVKISGRGDFIASGNHRYSSEKGGLFFYQFLNGTWNKTPNSLDGLGLGLGKLGVSDGGYTPMDINERGTMAIIGHRINSSNGGRIWVVTLDHTINSFIQQPIPIIDASTVVAQIIGINTNIDPTYQMSVGGGVQSTFYNATSDERLKTNIETLYDPLQQVEQLRGVSYNWKHEPESGLQYGLIAQELEQIIPEAVSNSNTNNKYGFQTKNINYFALIPFLVESITVSYTHLTLPTILLV